MAEITNELMYEVLEHLQSDMAALREGQRETNAALNAIRMHMVGLQQDIQNISALTRHQAPVPFKVMD
jgi:ribosome recycling factor